MKSFYSLALVFLVFQSVSASAQAQAVSSPFIEFTCKSTSVAGTVALSFERSILLRGRLPTEMNLTVSIPGKADLNWVTPNFIPLNLGEIGLLVNPKFSGGDVREELGMDISADLKSASGSLRSDENEINLDFTCTSTG